MIDFLVFCGIFKLLWLTETSPKNIPFGGARWNYSDSGSFHGVYDRIVNVG